MPMLADQVDAVIGVDTHHDTHTASIVTPLGAELAHLQAPADAAGYEALLDFARTHAPGPRMVWALEGTRSHGTGLARALQDCGERVVEVDRPKRPVRKRGKSDPIDATRAARDALTQERLAEPRADGAREELRVLLVARDHHARMRTATVNTFKAFLLTAPEPLRAQFRGMPTTAQIVHAAGLDAAEQADDAVLTATLAQLAGVVRMLDTFLAANKTQLTALTSAWMPELPAEFGIGPVAAAQLLVSWSHPGRCRSGAAFAMLAGTAPLPASSGRVTRHRLNRGGDRQLNRALHIIAIHRLRHDPRTRDYADRRRAAGSTDRETRRCLKNYLARHLWRVMEHHQPAGGPVPAPEYTAA
jgi:transposase